MTNFFVSQADALNLLTKKKISSKYLDKIASLKSPKVALEDIDPEHAFSEEDIAKKNNLNDEKSISNDSLDKINALKSPKVALEDIDPEHAFTEESINASGLNTKQELKEDHLTQIVEKQLKKQRKH